MSCIFCKSSVFFLKWVTFPQHFLPFLLRTDQKSNQKEIPAQKKEVSVDFLCYFILLQLLSPTFKNVSFYQINNRLVTISSDKVHELLVAISIYNNRSIREPRYVMAKRGLSGKRIPQASYYEAFLTQTTYALWVSWWSSATSLKGYQLLLVLLYMT